jgi:hypothetical protein
MADYRRQTDANGHQVFGHIVASNCKDARGA